MTDKKLDQILKQALAPEIDDSEIIVRGKLREQQVNMNKKKMVRRSFPAAAAIAGILFLGGVTAYAAGTHFGLFAFTKQSAEQIPETAKELIVEDVQQTVQEDASIVDCTVEEALCDQNTIMLVCEISAKEQGKYLFVPEYATEDDDMGEWSRISGISAGDYAKEKGLTIACIGGGITNTEELGIPHESMECRSISDDAMAIYIRCDKENKAKSMDVEFSTTARVLPEGEITKCISTFALEDLATASVVGYSATLKGADNPSYAVTNAELIQTKLGTYLDVNYSTESESPESVTFKVKDAEGKEITTIGGSGIELKDDGTYYERLIMNKMDPGEEFVLEFYDYMRNKVCESYRMSLK
ncbi:MAG: DUF4179 domain-containing protein [Lachnospiraceae bacterium]|nr:DUF4179 domain-containing protein [Lachnospiraceae bacterium]